MPRRKRRDPEFTKMVGERIKHAREAAGLIQQGIAAATDVEVSTVGGWEIGHGLPSLQDLPIIAQKTGRSPGYFVGMDPRPELDEQEQDALAIVRLLDEQAKGMWLAAGEDLARRVAVEARAG